MEEAGSFAACRLRDRRRGVRDFISSRGGGKRLLPLQSRRATRRALPTRSAKGGNAPQGLAREHGHLPPTKQMAVANASSWQLLSVRSRKTIAFFV